jgi:L-aminopeptidase/D-esterase-like protein
MYNQIMENKTLTALNGVKVGHATHLDKLTGTTVVIFDKPLPIAYKTYGGSPGTFNTDAFSNGKSEYYGNAIFISGGSWTGLQAGGEIMKRLIEKGIGFKTGKIINPNITGAIVFDLGVHVDQFNPVYGREAVDNATNDPVQNGNVGAGTGTSIGKFQFLEKGTKIAGMKAGVGSARIDLGNGIVVAALSVVNAVGNVINRDGSILGGNRDEHKKFKTFEDTTEFVTDSKMNTTISIVGTNVNLKTREKYERMAHFGALGQVRAVDPVHTSVDGDTVFAFSTEEITSPLNAMGKYFETPDWPLFTVDVIGNAATKAVQESIYDACHSAETVSFKDGYKGVIPSVKDYDRTGS